MKHWHWLGLQDILGTITDFLHIFTYFYNVCGMHGEVSHVVNQNVMWAGLPLWACEWGHHWKVQLELVPLLLVVPLQSLLSHHRATECNSNLLPCWHLVWLRNRVLFQCTSKSRGNLKSLSPWVAHHSLHGNHINHGTDWLPHVGCNVPPEWSLGYGVLIIWTIWWLCWSWYRSIVPCGAQHTTRMISGLSATNVGYLKPLP